MSSSSNPTEAAYKSAVEKLGLKSSFHFSEINVMGLLDPLIKIFKLLGLRKNLINLFIDKKIDETRKISIKHNWFFFSLKIFLSSL